jgi:nucleotide-binding universal stress UspA family protein
MRSPRRLTSDWLSAASGRGAIGSALLGGVSHALAAHTKRPALIAPQHPS